MMALFVSFIVLLLIGTSFYCSAENVYCVTPTATSCSSCPPNSVHCATLFEYAQETEMYFTSSTTIVFLPGDHVLNRSIRVANITRLTIHGESSLDYIATVVHNGSVSFSFTNMTNFNIYSLAFTSYNRSGNYVDHPSSNSALFLQSIQHGKLVNCFFHNNFGIALTVHNTNIILADNKFTHNLCGCKSLFVCRLGCGITAVNSALTFTGNTTFLKNSHNSFKGGGGAILAAASLLHFTGNNNFIQNVNSANNAGGALRVGGAIYATHNAVLSFYGNNNFINNSADSSGGAIYTSGNVALSFIGSNQFSGNSAMYGGSIYAGNNISLTWIGTSDFSNNAAGLSGGAIHIVLNVVLVCNGTNNFINNSALYNHGGAIYASQNVTFNFSGNNTFINNSANGHRYGEGGGAIYTSHNNVLTFDGTNNFTSNSANDRGGTIYAVHKTLMTFTGSTNFVNNSANAIGGAICAENNISLSFTGNSSFSSNSAMQGGAISVFRNSTLTFDGSVNFTSNGNNTNKVKINNTASRVSHGGALYLSIHSTFSILSHTTVLLENNHATLGGAIYVYDTNPLIYCTLIPTYTPIEECFFQLPGQNMSNGLNAQLVFKNNIADKAGSVIYGGEIDHCKLTGLDSYSSGKVFDMLVHNNNTHYSTTSNISSDPLYICPCKNKLPHCGKSLYSVPHHYLAYPGETFLISVPIAAAGQRTGVVSSIVRSTVKTSIIDFYSVNLLDYQYLQQTNNTCTKFNYTVFSLSRQVKINVYPEGSPCSKYDYGPLYFVVDLNQACPPGFNISESARSCVCEPRLAQYTNQCNITNRLGQITRDSSRHFWVGYDNSSQELILHPHCPFDYCKNVKVVFPLNNTNVQCANNRSGLLCGACNSKGYSLVLGSSHCEYCANIYLLLLIPFALMGAALIFLLLICKLTVATGTLSGLVFYANIIGVNRTLFLPVKSTNALSVFIAWLNLDFGIDTCFYDGMDTYSKTWLQFVFPLYLWMLVGLVIVVSHYSQRFAKMLGSNPVSVLATLILLSYAKILRTLVAAVYFSHLEYPTYNRSVWLHDANVDYLAGKHIPLFLTAVLVFLFLFIPYTTLLLCGQWLQAISHLRLFSWINSARLKPFMDSYHAPYKAKHRYWPGLLLVLRCVLLLVFALNPQRDPSINLLVIQLGTAVLQLWAWVSGGVYKNWCLDALEGSFALNLIVLGVATYHTKLSGGDQLTVGYTSVSIALVTFVGILAYHIFQQLRHTKLWKRFPKLSLEFKKLNKMLKNEQAVNNLNNPINNPTESVNLDQLREPWLEDLLQPNHSRL